MRNYLALLFIALISLHLQAQPKKKKAVFIIADGIPADVLEKVHPPALKQVEGLNGYKRAHVGGEKGGYSQTPTISAVGYNSLLTGTWVNKHNVWGNDIKDPNYQYPTIFRLLKLADTSKKTAVFFTWLHKRTRPVGESPHPDGDLQKEYQTHRSEMGKMKATPVTPSLDIHNVG